MAQQYTTTSGVTLIIPGSYPEIKVQGTNSNLATTGVLMIAGEADGGPDYTLESNLEENSFGPDQEADVIAKYKSGNIVDAFRAAVTPANDTDIQGTFSRIIIAKTNASAKASSTLSKIGGGTYGTLYDKSFGKLGNLIYFTTTSATAEVKPTTGSFTYLPPIASLNMSFRVNGGAEIPLTVSALMLPPAFQAAANALSGIAATGGTNRGVLTATAGNIALTVVSGNAVQVDYDVAWSTIPSVGDTMFIPSGSAIQGATNKNRGSYVVTGATAQTILATKLLDNAGAPGAVTAPENVASTPVLDGVAPNEDVQCYAPVVITDESTTVSDGLGKTLEVNELTTGTDLFSNIAYALNTTKVTWVSKASAPKVLTSASEYAVTLNINRQVDNVQEELTAGGQIGIKLGYKGTTASMVINDTTLTITRTGGTGADLSLTLADYPTLADLVSFIGSQTGYNASIGTSTLANLSPSALDNGTFTMGSTFGSATARVKVDAFKFFKVINENSSLVQLGNPAVQTAAGLPDVNALKYLAGGTKGSTTDAAVQGAIDAFEDVQGNFLVPLFSRDGSLDVADALTESGSSYTIDTINAYSRTHALKMSTLKRRRNRQAITSRRDTFDHDKTAAGNLSSARVAMTFQDVKNVSSTGIKQYQPWMGAVLAAATQAAGFYRAITHKGINCTGALQAAGDWKDNKDSNVEDALLAGMLAIKKSDDGSFIWIADQTTYSKDGNFVFNSIQAMYAADIVALTSAQRMEKAFVGQSVADVSSAVALSAFQTIMEDFLRLKLLAASDDAPRGYKNVVIKISGPTMLVSVEIKLSTEILFIPISFYVTQVTQTATG